LLRSWCQRESCWHNLPVAPERVWRGGGGTRPVQSARKKFCRVFLYTRCPRALWCQRRCMLLWTGDDNQRRKLPNENREVREKKMKTYTRGMDALQTALAVYTISLQQEFRVSHCCPMSLVWRYKNVG